MRQFLLATVILITWCTVFHLAGYFIVDRYLDQSNVVAYLFGAGYSLMVIFSGCCSVHFFLARPLAKRKEVLHG